MVPEDEPSFTARDLLDHGTIYDELRMIAAGLMSREPSGHTLQPTAIVNEAYLRLSQHRSPWMDRESFIAAASITMRRVLVDHARRRRAGCRDVRRTRTGVEVDVLLSIPQGESVFELAELIDALAQLNERQATISDMRLFGQLTTAQIARRVNVSERTVEMDWRMARAWLTLRLREEG